MHAQRYKKGHQSSVYSLRLLHEPASVLQRPAASNISLLLPILPSTHISCYFIGPLLWLPVLPTLRVRKLGKIGKGRYMLEAAVRWRTEAGSCSNLVLQALDMECSPKLTTLPVGCTFSKWNNQSHFLPLFLWQNNIKSRLINVDKSHIVRKGLISLRWDWKHAQEGIKSLQSLLKNSSRWKQVDKLDKSVVSTLANTNVYWAEFCTEMVHQEVQVMRWNAFETSVANFWLKKQNWQHWHLFDS